MSVRYSTVKIPYALTQRIEQLLEIEGYRTVSEFVIEHTRRALEEKEKRHEEHRT
jgi:metal-responsive CopG/Arc/MetJ family transcriptional regulator